MDPVRTKLIKRQAKHPWSRYLINAVGRHITLFTPSAVYLGLINTKAKRKPAYQSLILLHLSDNSNHSRHQKCSMGIS